MDINFIIEVLPLFQKALFITLKLACIGIFFSIVIGLICNLLLAKENILLSSLVNAYIELSRNTPLLIQLFFLYYGLPKFGIKLDEQVCAIIGLSFLGGSYMSEALRAGIEAVHKNQIESGLSLGMNKFQLFRYVILPQAISISIPLIAANAIFLVKETSVVGIIAVKELMNLSKTLIGVYYKTYETMFLLIIFYLIILLPLSFILSYIERKMRYAEHGN
ncbi:amino acid ABC transporter permease [Aliarcobacter cibarius]|jgi:polar amino acid transport system permease protein|uniref:Amino acid ABC transporter permease n=1 Tax=Aliarcobacter cibarius TaxID=255507 RepID=A0ABY2V579_9BACT|nr:amino acid ABC transporter permease [Aliarcobacter cibarius]TLS97832.1 amino acid ABC transporter permease [Aliarcobacter cibarius]TLS98621.1 amino acid ABC transporter permease [Aliarcobacter cibarius]TLT02699.1 amino acid ABC transporter permease [Aliarcobacter cibarius]